MGLFGQALQEIVNGVKEPESFAEYLKRTGQPKRGAAPAVSVQSLTDLDPELMKANTMVLRLGRGTFGLVEAKQGIGDYFIEDAKVFVSDADDYVPRTPISELFSYSVLPGLVEAGLTNLALASGAVPHLLGLDQDRVSVPATGQSTFTFDVRPRSDLAGTIWKHTGGQVEVDALFMGTRAGVPNLFVMECKSGDRSRSLAKHKLTYAVAAVASLARPRLPLIPVYLRVVQRENWYEFCVAECQWHPGQAVDDLAVVTARRARLLGLSPRSRQSH